VSSYCSYPQCLAQTSRSSADHIPPGRNRRGRDILKVHPQQHDVPRATWTGHVELPKQQERDSLWSAKCPGEGHLDRGSGRALGWHLAVLTGLCLKVLQTVDTWAHAVVSVTSIPAQHTGNRTSKYSPNTHEHPTVVFRAQILS
jgi:hypothetical protein